jgi:cytochrome c oxidase subunit 3
VTIALPAAPAPAPRRQILVAVAFASAAVAMLVAGMLAMWLRFRAAAPVRESSDGLYLIKDWLPESIRIPEVAANTMFTGVLIIPLMAQWAVYSARRGDTRHRSMALLVCMGLGLAVINAQVAVYSQMEIGVADGAYQSMFYAVTGTMVVLIAAGMAFSAVAFFRTVGGRTDDGQVVAGHALYWYVIAAAFTAMWFVVYVQK